MMDHAKKTRFFGLENAKENVTIMEHFREGFDSTAEEIDQRYQIEFVIYGVANINRLFRNIEPR